MSVQDFGHGVSLQWAGDIAILRVQGKGEYPHVETVDAYLTAYREVWQARSPYRLLLDMSSFTATPYSMSRPEHEFVNLPQEISGWDAILIDNSPGGQVLGFLTYQVIETTTPHHEVGVFTDYESAISWLSAGH